MYCVTVHLLYGCETLGFRDEVFRLKFDHRCLGTIAIYIGTFLKYFDRHTWLIKSVPEMQRDEEQW